MTNNPLKDGDDSLAVAEFFVAVDAAHQMPFA